MSSQHEKPLRVIRRSEVQARLGIARSTLYTYLDKRSASYLPNFPKPVRIGTAVGFMEHELDAFVENLMRARESEAR
jgi:prophage regulatory protein